MLQETISIINWSFFCVVVLPRILKYTQLYYKGFKILDLFFDKTYSKFIFCLGLISIIYRQWLNGNVIKKENNEYEICVIINREQVKFKIAKNDVEISDIQDIKTDVSYLELAKPYLSWKYIPWLPPSDSIVFLENGNTYNLNANN